MIKGILHKIDRQTVLRRLLLCIALFSAPCSVFNVFAQITIGGNVYGGGNAGATEGQTKVVVRAGEIQGEVYGGARQADVKGSAFVNIDGEHMSGDILINRVFGGNDISGTIGSSETLQTTVPTELTHAADYGITNENTYNAYVLTTPERTQTATTGEGDAATTTTTKPYGIFIGQLFGGGNGDYDYTKEEFAGKSAPNLVKTYLELRGGTIAYVYGGGNNATVTEATDICIDNSAGVTTSIPASASGTAENKLRDLERLKTMGIAVLGDVVERDLYHFSRVFGGNNKAEMKIRPTWHLLKGNIENLYSGGNEGDMTSPEGLVLQIDKGSEIMVHNVYGGCRKADVRPLYADGTDVPNADIKLNPNPNNIPAGFSARTRILGGNITNVYGGNDISGNVYGGNTVGIFTTIHGDVYGGGNGSYPYTDNAALKDHDYYRDYYYDPGDNSVEALNNHRPNAEQVSILLRGTEAEPVFVEGAVYVGGNSASLQKLTDIPNRQAHVKIGSYVTVDKVFLGNNGENMVKSNVADDANDIGEGVLRTFANTTIAGSKFNSIDLTDASLFAKYMEGCAMKLMPGVLFESKANGDPYDYEHYSSQFGSFYFGGNVGSMMTDGLTDILLDDNAIIYNKVVGGCNKADVDATEFNAAFKGGLLGSPDANGDKLKLTFAGLKVQPKRWKNPDDLTQGLVWNTYIGDTPVDAPTDLPSGGTSSVNDKNRRLKGGNVYGGCYESGHVNGNVIINLNKSLVDRQGDFAIFDQVEKDEGEAKPYHNSVNGEEYQYTITKRNSGVILDEQGMDVLGAALNVFGGGYGKSSEIWGTTTINLNGGYTFQIFGGGELGPVGNPSDTNTADYDTKYSTYINLNGAVAGVARDAEGDSEEMAEAEFIYGGGFEGLVYGSTHIHLGNGRIFNSFAGACNADILGHTETYVGSWTDKAGRTVTGFPWIRDHVYGGNDLGGHVLGSKSFVSQVSDVALPKVYGYSASNATPDVLTASAYMEYNQGRVENIFGGCYGDYDYSNAAYSSRVGEKKPHMDNAFVNIRPFRHNSNVIKKVFGAGQGYTGDRDGDKMQNRSYVLIDIPQGMDNFRGTEVFGAGAYDGLGMAFTPAEAKANPDNATAVIDLVRGQISAAYGGSFNEGVTRRTMVNVPVGSTIHLDKIFGGAYGNIVNNPCDVYESNVNYRSSDALVSTVYGGNNSVRRTVYAKVNVSSEMWSDKAKGYMGTVYGAGFGPNTWAEYTEINLERGAMVYEVYGGGQQGTVQSAGSIDKYMEWNPVATAWNFGDYYHYGDNYFGNTLTNLDNDLVRRAELDVRANPTYKYNTNVIINEGATVTNYVYGGGYGSTAAVTGSTYVALLGGTVMKDIYGSGTSGSVSDTHDAKTFKASTNIYIKGGTVRNVYGGGWRGHVGRHDGLISDIANNANDIFGEANVVIGDVGGSSFFNGVPAVTRNVYGGGEGGAIFGTANVTVNNGYIGYRYVNGEYVEELDDVEVGDNQLDEGGNVFGGGYVANSYVDSTNVVMWGGTVRGGLYGGGEIGPVGRGTVLAGAPEGLHSNGKAQIYMPGATQVILYNGHVMRDVFGGGRGFDNWGGEGYMTAEEKNTMDLSSKGFVFGSTDVRIRGGEVGTVANVAKGYGNVFGGGNVGLVYSGTGVKHGDRGSQAISELSKGLPVTGGGYYYKTWYPNEADRDKCELSLDCNVVVEPYALVTSASGISLGDKTFRQGEYVPTDYLNLLQDKNHDSRWDLIDYESGVTIHNAVFAGGNITTGSDQVSASTSTVFGNVTAALRDVYNRDLITLGTEHVGGLYGDGNLTFVDGWRELHVSNYGTDYYSTDETITKETYNSMSDRERAYFVLNYRVKEGMTVKDKYNESHSAGWRVTSDEFKDLFEDTEFIGEDGTPNMAYFDELGFCSIYAGRLLNTIQRCDMAAIWGSRIVLQGARDRVPEKADYTRYTINRVGELSLNQQKSSIDGDDTTHGNYFGIYSVVNYLGNLTSDVFFTHEDVSGSGYSSIRTTNSANPNNQADGTTTYYDWKINHAGKSNRNNATSPNKVCLASGVYLEIIREESEKSGKTEWGLITGVVELDLIDVKTGLGGGYVYARNQHGIKSWHRDWEKVNLSPYNLTARTYKRFTYTDSSESDLREAETSGNFVHNTKQIVDDCYPNINAYVKTNSPYSEAHYWYIKGSVYVYDQYISAYTGSANAYAETVNIPLTISAASHGRMTLREVQPNRYAYYNNEGAPLGNEGSVIINDITYKAGDPIDYWTYQSLSAVDQSRFVDEVYTTIAECKIGDTTYPEGTILLPSDYEKLRNTAPKEVVDEDDAEAVPAVYHVEQGKDVAFDFVFRPANNIGHDTGYVLTYDVNNPSVWSDYYTKVDGGTGKTISLDAYNALSDEEKQNYIVGPTYTPLSGGVYGQRKYNHGEIIAKHVVDDYPATLVTGRDDQAVVEEAYVVTKELTTSNKTGTEQHLYPGTPVVQSAYTAAQWSALSASLSKATVCTTTLEMPSGDPVFAGSLLSVAEVNSLKQTLKAANTTWTDAELDKYLKNYLDDAYYCSEEGLYGGSFFEAGKSYSALKAWCSLTDEDRTKFRYNYDGLDLFIDPTYGGGYGNKVQYDGYMPGSSMSSTTPQYTGSTTLTPKLYSPAQPVDYEAEYTGGDGVNDLTYIDEKGKSVTVRRGYDNRLKRAAFEDIPNERIHWAPVIIQDPGTYYVVKEAFISGDIPYTVGQVIDSKVYSSLSADKKRYNIDPIVIKESDVSETGEALHLYYCREAYTINENGEGKPVTTLGIKSGSTVSTYGIGDVVPTGVLINEATYQTLVNKQAGFVIHGMSPEETTTLYVARQSDIYNLQKEKIITVIYLYEYEESDETGNNITPVSERHIVNIHINFESGVPEIGPLSKPTTVIPGTTVGLKIPTVTPGAFEITSSGWEIFTNEDDAELHVNGQPYQNNNTPMYWYQNNYWVAYYAQTYLGKTYSNPVQFSVANYHDLKKVMDDKQNHYFIDHKDVDRAPKIYLNDYKVVDGNGQETADSQNGLDLLKDLYDLSRLNSTSTGVTNGVVTADGSLNGHSLMDDRVKDAKGLEFFLHTNIDHSGSAWTPIAAVSDNADNGCFEGTLHGEGYYLSGMTNSLFGRLCGSVYNLGVMGSFTSAGVADTGDGYVANCWVKTTGTPAEGVKAVFGNPSAVDGSKQLFNSYYPETNAFAAGDAQKMPEKAFYNGEVAYNLNSYYLYKRYYDHNSTDFGTTPQSYSYFVEETAADAADGSVTTSFVKKDGKYGTDFTKFTYVEDRYADGDFYYADGVIPEGVNQREYIDEQAEDIVKHYYPLWPDDYLFFGQTLNYGHVEGYNHQDVPSAIAKSDTRLVTSESGNRVYRAPAYFKNSVMQKVHFNPYAIFATSKFEDPATVAHKDLTAIDFTGYNDVTKGYKKGLVANSDGSSHFFPPLLDEAGLTGFHNVDLTQNLLVYSPDQQTNQATYDVLDNYLDDIACVEEADDETTADIDESLYRRVGAVKPADVMGVKGHLVVATGNAYVTDRDHFLVDRQDFNAPIAYTFGAENRMWYQRTPDNYVDEKSGWEAVSLPFSAELVTTQTKGEISHFYDGSTTGHEYWLREFKGGAVSSTDASTFVANFNKPAAGTAKKYYTNTFLWDYYYSYDTYLDKNTDEYQKTYYQDEHVYSGYPYNAAGTAYIVGFPGSRYYEFDLSGQFVPQYTHKGDLGALDAQTVTFASATGAFVAVSDGELKSATANGYNFVPNYLNATLSAAAGYVLNGEGSSFDKSTTDAVVGAFRPYFTKAYGGTRTVGSDVVEHIVFGSDSSTGISQQGDPSNGLDGTLKIYAKKRTIIVESTLNHTAEVSIYTPAGIKVASFAVKAGETVETQAAVGGVYIVQGNANKVYTRKLIVR